jgi:outer membrane protein assembly factor BamB/orotate phosphoribosyltransferase
MSTTDREKIRRYIVKEVFVRGEDIGRERDFGNWIFDFRAVLLNPDFLNTVSNVFYDTLKALTQTFQVGGIESAALPLISGVVMKARERGDEVHGFYIRKSRKKQGLTKIVEGTINKQPIVLLDDIMNRSNSLLKQIEVLESMGERVYAVLTIIRYRDVSYYEQLHKRGIKIISLFDLTNFPELKDLAPLSEKEAREVPRPYVQKWYFKSENFNPYLVVQKSAPVLDEEKVYVGSDSGVMWALSQKTGSVAWSFTMKGVGSGRKRILSTPAVDEERVYFGAYDGVVYALHKHTGKLAWTYEDADWVGSSPTISHELGLLYIGLEFGLFGKKGGIVALDIHTGRLVWNKTFKGLTHSSPAYSQKHSKVVIGSNCGTVACFDAKDGRELWEVSVPAEVRGNITVDEKRGYVLFGCYDSNFYILSLKTGEQIFLYKCYFPIYSTPLVVGDVVVFASLDKNVYCVDLETLTLQWKFETEGRVFASPALVEDKVLIGSNDGRLYELDIRTGENTAIFQATERIVNRVAYNPTTKVLFVPTFANEIYALKKE